MLLGMGAAEMIVGLTLLIASIMANCTPTTITAATWMTLHALIGLIQGITFYFIYGPTAETKRRVRLAYFALILIGIGLGIAAAIHGGVGRTTTEVWVPPVTATTYSQNKTYSYPTSIVSVLSDASTPNNQTFVHQVQAGYYNYSAHYDFDEFFGIFIALFEAGLLAWGIWMLFADRDKEEKMRTLANSRGASFASLAAYRQNVEQETLKHSHSGFLLGKKKESKADLTEPEAAENSTTVVVTPPAAVPADGGKKLAVIS